ncbi:MAG: metallophosphoesterase family protein [Actinomycetota bacterium]|nr:metallophosphoesterase family protein [Actinomycetota bacterium]
MDPVILGVISDTHIYRQPLPAEVLRSLEGVDMILHAGDVVEIAVLEELERLAHTVAVAGNMDHAEVKRELPAKTVLEAGGYRLGLVHGSGGAPQITRRLRREFEQVDILVFGHTHQACNHEEEGVYSLNPGSPTDKMFAPFRSVGILEIDEKVRGRIIMLE